MKSVAERVPVHLARVLESEDFRRSPSISRMLQVLVEHRLAGTLEALTEYDIATKALGRGESFDPQLDPIVRVQMRQLRLKLGNHYSGAGANDELRFQVPLRSYRVDFVEASARTAVTEPPVAAVEEENVAIPEIGSDQQLLDQKKAVSRRWWLWAGSAAAGVAGVSWVKSGQAAVATSNSQPGEGFYQKAEFFRDQRTRVSLRKALAYYDQALATDPKNAHYMASKAMTWIHLGANLLLPYRDCFQKARELTATAKALDPERARVWVSEGLLRIFAELQPTSAVPILRQAQKLDPQDPTVNEMLSIGLLTVNNFSESLLFAELAEKQAPTSFSAARTLMLSLNETQQFRRALEVCRKAAELNAYTPQILVWQIFLEEAVYGKSLMDKGKVLAAVPDELQWEPWFLAEKSKWLNETQGEAAARAFLQSAQIEAEFLDPVSLLHCEFRAGLIDGSKMKTPQDHPDRAWTRNRERLEKSSVPTSPTE
jgi:tetratricopeptide (TPR) repeat protein